MEPDAVLNGSFIRGSGKFGYVKHMRRRKFITGFLAIIATGLAVAPPIALADHERKSEGRGRGRGRGNRQRNESRPKSFYEEGPAGRSSGQDRARRALREGRVLPLGEIMTRVRRNFPGKVLDADLVRDGNRFVYYLKVLDPRGRVARIAVDGQSGRILGVKGRGR
jgi:hypothetical protein